MSTPETQKVPDCWSDIKQARKVLYPGGREKAGKEGEEAVALDDLVNLGKRLSKCNAFGYARKIYLVARDHRDMANDATLNLKVIQQQAICTYKDVDLPLDVRLARALDIIKKAEQLSHSIAEKQETLGITGAIHKRRWEVDNQRQHLEAGLNCYERGFKLGPMSDATGYTGINAAFIYDILAWQDEETVRPSGEKPANAEHLRDEARNIRARIAAELSDLAKTVAELEEDKWVRATLAEAYFGLKNFDQAKIWLDKYKESGPDEWEREATARQLANLARFQDPGLGPGTKLRILLPGRY
jgi:tetratricopeptide (TPR) repeat protein